MTHSDVVDVSAEPIEKALGTVARATRYLSGGSEVTVAVADEDAAAELVAWCGWAGHGAAVDPVRRVVVVTVRVSRVTS